MRVGSADAVARLPSSPERPDRSFTSVLGERAGSGAAPPPSPPSTLSGSPAVERTPKAATPAPVGAFLERTLTAEREVDALLQAAARGKTFSPGELLALQASVFRYSQTVEVVSRVADRLVGAIKQTMGTQV